MSNYIYMGVIAPSVIIIPLAIASYKKKKDWGVSEKLLISYLLCSALFNVIAYLIAFKFSNLPLLHLYTIIEFWLLCFLFRSFFIETNVRVILKYMAVCFTLFAVTYIVLSASLFKYNTLPRFLESILVLGQCIYFLYTDLTRVKSSQPTFNFVVVVGLMLYFSSSSILFAFSEIILQNQELSIIIWNIHATIMGIMYLMFAYAFLQLNKDKRRI